MNAIILNQIQETANKFAKIAKRVNISSRLRTNHSKEALVCITYLQSIISNLLDDFQSIAEKNINQKDSDLNMNKNCENLKEDTAKLSEIIQLIEKDKLVNNKIIKKIKAINDNFQLSITKIIEKLDLIISRDNEIINKDEQIIELKKAQQQLLVKLQEDTQQSCNDAVKAARGSQSNLERGLKIFQMSEQMEDNIKNKNITELNELVNETKRGWQIADDVNIRSTSQLEFAEKVNENTMELHNKSQHIESLVVERHKFYTESLHLFAELTEIFSEQFKKYSEFDAIAKESEVAESKNNLLKKLVKQIGSITETANYIMRQNNEKITNSVYYSEHETNTVEITKEEIRYFDKIIEEIEFMTETTRYPIEGSNNNITNGQILEQLLVKALHEHDIPVYDE